MNFDNPNVWTGIGFAGIGFAIFALTHYFSDDSRLERRRRKSNSRIVAKSRRPMVKFSVSTPQLKR